ncbi:MAG: type II CRISPR-associated endonuclease Cas1 [Brevinemataceae bacterium]
MGWRVLTIDNPGKLSLRDNQLVFKTQDNEKIVPIEDLECVLLENQQIEITHPLLNRLAEDGVMLVTTNPKYQASGILVSFWGQYQKLNVLQIQLSASEPLKKRCWQRIITQKILNQALVLKKLKVEHFEDLIANSKKVQSGDASHLEGSSSAFYFRRLFEAVENKFVRQQYYDKEISLINAGLNYGYALARAILTRHIITSGLLPYLGIHHISKVNAFNLADDLIETFRPIVDYHVYQYLDYFYTSNDEQLSREIRLELQKIFTYQLRIEDRWIKFPAACRAICYSFIRALEEKNPQFLLLPHDWKEEK